MQWFGKGSNNVEDGRSGGGGKTILGGGIGIIVVVLGLIFCTAIKFLAIMRSILNFNGI